MILFVNEQGWGCRFEWAYRSPAVQQGLVEAGKSRTMKSKHLDRLAVDLTFFDPDGRPIWDKDALQQFGDYFEALNPKNRWGGNWTSFVDTPHFERRP